MPNLLLTLETDTIAPQALQSLLEELLTVGRHAGHVVLFPFNGSIHILKNLLDGLGNLMANTISRNQSNLGGKTRLSWRTLGATGKRRTV
jgi:hypothetical protein